MITERAAGSQAHHRMSDLKDIVAEMQESQSQQASQGGQSAIPGFNLFPNVSELLHVPCADTLKLNWNRSAIIYSAF